MKKIILSVICFFICLTMVGCGSNSDSQALKNLNTQLNRVSEIVSSTSSSEVSEVSPSTVQPYTNNNYQLPRLKESAYQNMIKEEELRQDVLSLNAYLKNNQTKKYKLGKYKASALNDLSSNLSKYVTCLNNTKSNIKNSVNKIKKSTNIHSLDIEKTKVAYLELGNNMNERLSYLSNLYNTLNEIAYLLDNNCIEENKENSINNNQNIYNGNSPIENNQNISTQTDFNKKTNIDTFNNNSTNNNLSNNNLTNNNSYNLPNQYNNRYMNYQNYGNYNNYDYNYWYGRNNFNPNRNTDTFFPKYRNIDTFKFYPNNNYYNNSVANNYTNNSQSTLKDFNNTQKTIYENNNYTNVATNKNLNRTEDNKEDLKNKLKEENKNNTKNNVISIQDKHKVESPNKNIHDLKNYIDNFLNSNNNSQKKDSENNTNTIK